MIKLSKKQLSKTQLSKINQKDFLVEKTITKNTIIKDESGGFLSRLLGPLLKTGLTLIKNIIKPLAKSVLIPLRLTAAASAADAGIQKKY